MEHNYSALQEVVLTMTSIFERRRLKYVLIGGQAISHLTRPRYTKDVDFLIEIPQIQFPGVVEEVIEQGGELEVYSAIKAWNSNHMLSFQFKGSRVDWLKPIVPAYYHVIQHGSLIEHGDKSYRIASLEGLALLKLMAFRPMDKVDIESIIATKLDQLDLEWIKSEWLTIGELVQVADEAQHITSGGS